MKKVTLCIAVLLIAGFFTAMLADIKTDVKKVIKKSYFNDALNEQDTNTMQKEFRIDLSTESIKQHKEFKHALNICPIAPFFGVYALNYEYMISPKNGILARIEYENVPKTYTDASIESNGMSYSLNYRRHLSGKMNSVFLGAYIRHKVYKGNGEIESKKFNFTIHSSTIGLNGGKRWVWNSRFNMTLSMGYGISTDNSRKTHSDNSIEDSLVQLEKDCDFMSPFYAEVSIGYVF